MYVKIYWKVNLGLRKSETVSVSVQHDCYKIPNNVS